MGFATALLGGLGGAGGLGSALSTIGSLFGAVSSFMGGSEKEVSMPQAVNVGPSTPTPDLPANPATILSSDENQAISDIEKRRLAAGRKKTNAQSTTLAGDNTGNGAVERVTLLGG
jgi:hypothetical protein